MMDHSIFLNAYRWMLITISLVLWFQDVRGQSCGPRVSARLLAEIPCDMSKSSYCSAPGSAYPWSSVKRYINDNQGLVRRMYGDEKHSSVLLNEIDGFRVKFDMLRSFVNMNRRFGSRTEYGRSARGSRRQPRPQIFEDDDEETPATIFRVVTETSIKVGEPITRPMTSELPSRSPATAEPTVASATSDQTSTMSSSLSSASGEMQSTSTKETFKDNTYSGGPTSAATGDVTYATTTVPSNTVTTTEESTSTTSIVEELPVAMERIGYAEEDEDYDYEPGRNKAAVVLQNSVEEKTKEKQQSDAAPGGGEGVVKRNNYDGPTKYDGDAAALMYEVVADDVDATAATEESVSSSEATEAKSGEDGGEASEEEEVVPRRGINACPVKNEVIAPYWANNTRGETLALLNVHPFEQYVHFEKCAFENHQMLCREGCRCEQQYRLHRLLAFDPKNECRGIFSDWFRFPSCCVCICYDLTPDIPRTRRKGRMK